jgi:hypothetical protein
MGSVARGPVSLESDLCMYFYHFCICTGFLWCIEYTIISLLQASFDFKRAPIINHQYVRLSEVIIKHPLTGFGPRGSILGYRQHN